MRPHAKDYQRDNAELVAKGSLSQGGRRFEEIEIPPPLAINNRLQNDIEKITSIGYF